MSILVIGGAGFVGTALLEYIKYESNVAIFDNFMWGDNIKIPKWIKVIKGDIRDKKLIASIVPQYEYIVHLAGIVGAPACDLDPQVSYDINVMGTKNIVDSCNDDQCLLFVSSTSAYGNQSGLVTESTPLAPLTSYGRHKAEGEQIVLNGRCSMPIIFRPATAFGISQRIRIDLLPNTLAYIALTKGIIDLFEPNVIRPFIHVNDFAELIAYAIVDGQMDWGEIYNIGDPNLTMRKEELAGSIANLANAEIIIREGTDPDQRNYDVSFDKILGQRFKFSKNRLELGLNQIRDCVESIKQNLDLYSTTYITQKFIHEEKNGLYGTNYMPSL